MYWASPKEEPVVGDGEIEDLEGGEGGVDGAVRPQRQAQQADEEGRPVPARDTMDQQPRVTWNNSKKYCGLTAPSHLKQQQIYSGSKAQSRLKQQSEI